MHARSKRPHRRQPPRPPGLVDAGARALAAALEFKTPADQVLRRFFRAHPQLGRRDRGYIAETVFAALRRLRYFSWVAGSNEPRALFAAAARTLPAGTTSHLPPTRQSDQPAPDADPTTLSFGVRAELPDWALQRLRTVYTEEETLAIGVSMQSGAPLDLRVNTLVSTREAALDALAQSEVPARATPNSPIGIRCEGKPALEQHPLYLSGAIEVQDEGSQLLGYLLAPRRRELVVDFCAGAGGKTLLLGALMRSEGRLYAFDIAESRLRRLRARLGRSGLSNVHPELLAHEADARLKRLAGKADRVLVDAPCTGFGTLRRNPDLKWRQSAADLATLSEKQTRILNAAARLVKAGGRLVYATCSIFPQENDEVVQRFLTNHADFSEIDCASILSNQGIVLNCGQRLHLLPHIHGTDGFFAAVMERAPA